MWLTNLSVIGFGVAAVFVLFRYANVDYKIGGGAVLGLVLVAALLEAIVNSKRLGLF